MSGIFIFRRDYRIEDNLSLYELGKVCKTIYPVFIFTPEQIQKNSYFSSNSFQFLMESLKELDSTLKHKLNIYFGENEKVIDSILKKYSDIQYVAYNRDYTPYAKSRDKKIEKVCKKHDIEIISKDDYTIHPMSEMRDGSYFSVFKPFYEKVMKMKTPKLLPAPSKVSYKSISNLSLKKFEKYYTPNKNVIVHGGRKNAQKILRNISKFKNYAKTRDIPTKPTTLLSAYIKYGCVSIREVYVTMIKKLGKRNELIRQVVWHDFYANMMNFLPSKNTVGGGNYKNKKVKWISNKRWLDKWMKGKTGFPIIDAFMRQLNTTGWMQNRGRLLVSNFLTFVLHQNWRLGEKYFARQLVDYDVTSNNMNWQFSAGVGTDRTPYVRIYNPWKQSLDIDKDCKFIKEWIPELKDVENKYIHHWYKYYEEIDSKYTKPIVDFDKERKIGLKQIK